MQALRDHAIGFAVTLFFAAVPAQATTLSSLSATITPSGDYGQIRAASTHNADPADSLDDLYTAFGFDAFPQDLGFSLRVGAIRASDWTGLSTNWDNGLYLHVEWVSGTAGQAYTVFNGVSDTSGLGVISNLATSSADSKP